SVNKYYFASDSAAEDAAGGAARTTAVADPVYVRRRVEPLAEAVRALIDGPTSSLGSAVTSSFPAGSGLAKDVTALTPDEHSKLTVPLNGKAARADAGECAEMATQLLFTLENLTPAVDEVELRSGDEQ
ncbi:GerMN domain-containing protein, partial [Streptomyces sp. TRM76130]|nr:GerMN domain-containing protein [Streptomyces sp. TRM76130]